MVLKITGGKTVSLKGEDLGSELLRAKYGAISNRAALSCDVSLNGKAAKQHSMLFPPPLNLAPTVTVTLCQAASERGQLRSPGLAASELN